MKENRGRAQLIFRLDDPVQKEAFDILQNRVYRGKAVYVAKCIVAQENEEKMAERIAQKIVETLSRQTPPVIQPPKRKRGRPPKQSSVPTISEPSSADLPAPRKAKKKPVEKQTKLETPQEIPSPAPIEESAPTPVPLPKPAQENTFIQQPEDVDGIPDDEMLQSMENFITGVF